MKNQNRSVLAQSSNERTPARAADLDALANEIFGRLSAASSDDALSDLQHSLARAAEALARPTSVVEGAVQNTLRALPPTQLDSLIQHMNGMTRAQIAERQGNTNQTVLKDLASAYAQLRFSLDTSQQTDIKSPSVTPSLSDVRGSN